VDNKISLSSSNSSSNIGTKRQLQDLSNLCSAETPLYIVTLDSKYLILAPFFDNSFRVYSTETGKYDHTQIVYGHRGLITCLVRSKCNVADFYIASGSKDCCVLVWTWNSKYEQIEGNNNMCSSSNQIVNPLPKLTLTGHEAEIKSLLISAELGLIVSGSLNTILLHTTTNGDIVCYIDIRNQFKKNLFHSKTSKHFDINAYFKNTKGK
jgi:WD40 repeat protein